MAYESIRLKKEFVIDQIVTIHYFEYMSDFSYPGESHDFWELLCVDKGVVNVQADARTHTLKAGDLIFHKPREFHNVKANGVIAPNLVVISFICKSPAMLFFENKILKVDSAEREILARIIAEAKAVYLSRLDDPFSEKLIRRTDGPFGAEQLIQMYLQQLLILLVRRCQTSSDSPSHPKSLAKNSEDELFYHLLEYMNTHLTDHLTIDQICRDNLVSRSVLQKLFQERAGCGIIDYFSKLKISAAKQLIRNRSHNFSQIADELGYSSIHYFSRQFKKITGMTPSEYSGSIKALTER